MSSSLQVGIANRNINPPIGTALFGYPQARFGNEVDDDLQATALVLSSGDVTACIIALDLCLIDEEELDLIRSAVSEATSIAPLNITVCASHTHSGPTTVTAFGWGEKNQPYLDQARQATVEA